MTKRLVSVLCGLFLVIATAIPAAAQNTRLSFDANRAVMIGDTISSTLYEVPVNGGLPVASMSLAGMSGLYDVFSTGTALCAQAWVSGVPPVSITCPGSFIGVINPLSEVGKCLQLRGYNRRCDLWNLYNPRPLTMEVGGDVFLPSCPPTCLNGWENVPTDGVARFFWQNSGYNAVVLMGREGERADILAYVNASLYIGPNFSNSALYYYQLSVSFDVVSQVKTDVCGFMGDLGTHVDVTQPSRSVSLDFTAYTQCNAPSFFGAKQANLVESAGLPSAMVIVSGAGWSQQMTVRQHY